MFKKEKKLSGLISSKNQSMQALAEYSKRARKTARPAVDYRPH